MIRTLTEVNMGFHPWDFEDEEAVCIDTCSSNCTSCAFCDKDYCYCNEHCKCFCDEDCYLKCENDCKEEHSFNKTSAEVTTTTANTLTNGCRCGVERSEDSHSRIVGGTEITPVSSY